MLQLFACSTLKHFYLPASRLAFVAHTHTQIGHKHTRTHIHGLWSEECVSLWRLNLNSG